MRERIISIIDKLGLTQKKFAEQIGITAGGLTDFIKGRSKDLSSSTVANIVVKFSINPMWLLTGEGDMFIDTGVKAHGESFDTNLMKKIISIVTRMFKKEGLEMDPDKFAEFILFLYDRHKDQGVVTDKDIKDNVVLLKKFA